MKRPFRLWHKCCPNATAHLMAYRSERGYNWRITVGHATPYATVIFCPWCGIDLHDWAKAEVQRQESEAQKQVQLKLVKPT